MFYCAFGVDFSVPSDPETYEKDLVLVNRGLLKYGTTSYCPTIVSSSASVYHKVLSHLKPRAGSAQTGATILGAHVEGPFINEARIGAHELKVLQASAKNGYSDFKAVYGLEGETPEAQNKLSHENQNSVKIITCAPELEGIMDSIPDLAKAGITVSVGHSMANISQAEEAVQKGATFITHLFNAMPQFHHRDPGVIGLLGSRFDLPRPYYGLICDGIHVHPNSVKIAYDSHPEGVILVTDAMSAMGLAPGNYQLGNMNVTKEEDRVYIEGTDTLAGSVITLDACIRNFIQFTSCTLIEALEAVTLHPAVLLGIQETKGVIKPGADADLVFLSDDLFVKRVFVAGEEVDLDAIDVQVTEKF
ncbi:putative N-acetylglucosamine-6-phosphate deacetylase [Linnemannia zychae]|nr:putative N-acetylglucosamine-6-phosphate deacetylase [Linnemannia zychae]